MKEAFKRDMALLYPDGGVSQQQLRDLVRTFSMGWCDALMLLEAKDAVASWVEEFRLIADPNWWPDTSWQWWG